MLLLLIVLVAVGGGSASAETAPCFGCDDRGTTVTAGDGQFDITQFYEDAGGDLHPIGAGGGASSCEGCTYQVLPACPTNHPGSDGQVLCGGAVGSCPPGQTRYSLYLTQPPSTVPALVGSVCRGAGAQPVTLADVAGVVRQQVDRLVPPAPGVRVQPADNALVRTPVIFDASGLGPVSDAFPAFGVPVVVRVVPAGYDWSVDGVVVLHTAGAGRSYDGHSPSAGDGYYVSWTFADSGLHTVVVTARWTATFDALGQTGVPVAGQVSRVSAPTALTVHQARGHLVAE